MRHPGTSAAQGNRAHMDLMTLCLQRGRLESLQLIHRPSLPTINMRSIAAVASGGKHTETFHVVPTRQKPKLCLSPSGGNLACLFPQCTLKSAFLFYSLISEGISNPITVPTTCWLSTGHSNFCLASIKKTLVQKKTTLGTAVRMQMVQSCFFFQCAKHLKQRVAYFRLLSLKCAWLRRFLLQIHHWKNQSAGSGTMPPFWMKGLVGVLRKVAAKLGNQRRMQITFFVVT